MLKKLLKNNIVFNSNITSWIHAVQLSAQPLLSKHLIKQSYVDEIISSVKEKGFYIVIAPEVAFPHARLPDGVNEICISLLVSQSGIEFGEHHNIKLVFCVGFIDDNSHIEMLQELAIFLSDEKNLQALLIAKTEADVLNLL